MASHANFKTVKIPSEGDKTEMQVEILAHLASARLEAAHGLTLWPGELSEAGQRNECV